MLSGVLKNETAVNVSIGIMDAFVEMRRIISNYGHTFERLTNVEYKLLEHDKRFDDLFDQIQSPVEFKQGIFFKGQRQKGTYPMSARHRVRPLLS